MSYFDYENAEQDILENGGDPDYLSHYNSSERDSYLRNMGLHPEDYGGSSSSDFGSDFDSSDGAADEGCFLTSACVEAKGLPDDCEELTILRYYRDNYLVSHAGGKREIWEYYRIAPVIVKRINARANSKDIWNKIYEEMVLPCVRMIKTGAMEDAFQLYKSYTMKLAEF